ncbi:MAG: hypothetical protein E7553_06940 [Ruminococcaceae bacterium]|nr:hypothetical protein [Oscillospiraceae bacterium]
MKKRFLLVVLAVMLVLMSGCTADNSAELQAQVDELKTTVEQLQAENDGLKADLAQLQGVPVEDDDETGITDDGDTSAFPAYTEWLVAENSGTERDAYVNLIYGFIQVDDEIERGWLDDGTIKFLKVIKGDAIKDSMSAVEMINVYKAMDNKIPGTNYSTRDLFCVNDYDEPVNTGIYNFFEVVDQLEASKFGGQDVVSIDANGSVNGFDFDKAGGDAAIAKAVGISEEMVQILLHAAVDAGFDITFG